MPKTFSGEEFVRALAEDKLIEPVVLEGLVKKSDDPRNILFSPGISCLHWVPVPVSMVEKIEWVGKVPCKDHQHDYIRLCLKEPKDEAAVFVNLLQGTMAAASSTTRPVQHAGEDLTDRVPPCPGGCAWDPTGVCKYSYPSAQSACYSASGAAFCIPNCRGTNTSAVCPHGCVWDPNGFCKYSPSAQYACFNNGQVSCLPRCPS